MAAASLPPIAFTRITAEETGGGIQLTTRKPFNSQELISVKVLKEVYERER